MKRSLTATQKAFLRRFAAGELNGQSRMDAGAVAICRNLIKRGLLSATAEITEAGKAALAGATYDTKVES